MIGAFIELFTVMICLTFFLVAMYSKKETGNLLYIRCYIGNGKIATQLAIKCFTEQHTEI